MQLDTAATLLRSFMDATGMPVAEARTLLAKFGLVGAARRSRRRRRSRRGSGRARRWR